MDLVITSLGMVCSVGHDVATACASIRAGLSRPKPIPHFSVLDTEAHDAVPLAGHPLDGFGEGFSTLGFWIRVGAACLEDLVGFGQLPGRADSAFWARTALIGVTPPVNDSRFGSDDTATADFMIETYLQRLLDVFPCPLPPDHLAIVSTGPSGAIAAIRQAQAMMAERAVERVVVLAVDSYLDPLTLDWLATHHRLKTDDNPVGLTPGEAGACFLLETRAGARARRGIVRASVGPPGLAMEAEHFFSGNLSQGVALAAAVRDALSDPSAPRPFAGTMIADGNGEAWRAHELGCARVRLGDALGTEAAFEFPCGSLGDVGSASAAVAVCVAVRSLERGYARQDSALVLSRSEHGQVGAVRISRG